MVWFIRVPFDRSQVRGGSNEFGTRFSRKWPLGRCFRWVKCTFFAMERNGTIYPLKGNLPSLAMETTLYEQVGGFDRILALTVCWHELCLADPGAAHPFEHELHPHHDERLAAYLAEALGGPALYTAGYGDETYVQRLHAGNGVHIELDEACLRCFDQALLDVGVPAVAAESFAAYFRRVTEAMRMYGDTSAAVPDGLPLPKA